MFDNKFDQLLEWMSANPRKVAFIVAVFALGSIVAKCSGV